MVNADDPRVRLRRKADQHWDMAGLARQDGDLRDAERHTAWARAYEQQIRNLT
jgi:hypothetical protein